MIALATDGTVEQILGESARLRRLARRMTRCDADADDLVQNTLMRAYRARDRFSPGTSVRAWTRTILRRVFLTDAARSKRRRLSTDTDAGAPLAVMPERRRGSAERLPTHDELMQRLESPVKHAIDRLPEVYRVPFLLASVEDLTYGEISRRMSVPEGTVMSRIHRARRALQADLAGRRVAG